MTKETLGEKQEQHTLCLARLIDFMHFHGYGVRQGDAYRDPRAFGQQGEPGPYGEAKSAHKNKLGNDLDVTKNGVLLTKSEDYQIFGDYWKTLDVDNRWGGDFKKRDGRHFSRIYNGVC